MKEQAAEIREAVDRARHELGAVSDAAATQGELRYRDMVDAERITLDEVENAIKLVTWFKVEARRVYARMSETAECEELRDLVELAQRFDGTLTLRELRRNRAIYKNDTDAAHLALNRLVEAGLATWEQETHPQGGRPSPHIVLVAQSSDGR